MSEFLLYPQAGIGAAAHEHLEHEDIGQRQPHGRECQDPVEEQHHGAVESHADHADDAFAEITGNRSGNPVIGIDPVRDVSGMTLVEEVNRQAQQMPDEARRSGKSQFGFCL